MLKLSIRDDAAVKIADVLRTLAVALATELLDNASHDVPGAFHELMQRMLDHLKNLDQQVGELERKIRLWHRSNAFSCKLEKVPGNGTSPPQRC